MATDCDAYYYEQSECHTSSAKDLIGADEIDEKNGDAKSRKSRKHAHNMNDDAATETMMQENQPLTQIEVGQKSASSKKSKVLHEETFS